MLAFSIGMALRVLLATSTLGFGRLRASPRMGLGLSNARGRSPTFISIFSRSSTLGGLSCSTFRGLPRNYVGWRGGRLAAAAIRWTMAQVARMTPRMSCVACWLGLTLIAVRRLVKQASVLSGGLPLPLPANCKFVFAVLCIGKMGDAAVVYCATTYPGPELLVLDCDAMPLHGRLFQDTENRLADLHDQCRAHGRAIFVPESLARHAWAAGIPVHPIPADFVPEELLLTPRIILIGGLSGGVNRRRRRRSRRHSGGLSILGRGKTRMTRCGRHQYSRFLLG